MIESWCSVFALCNSHAVIGWTMANDDDYFLTTSSTCVDLWIRRCERSVWCTKHETGTMRTRTTEWINKTKNKNEKQTSSDFPTIFTSSFVPNVSVHGYDSIVRWSIGCRLEQLIRSHSHTIINFQHIQTRHASDIWWVRESLRGADVSEVATWFHQRHRRRHHRHSHTPDVFY